MASWGSATWGCRSPWRWAKAGLSVIGFEVSDAGREHRERRRKPHQGRSRRPTWQALRRSGKLEATTRHDAPKRMRRDLGLRPHAARQDEGPRHVLHRRRHRRRWRRRCAPGSWSCSSPRRIPAPRASSCCRASRQAGSRWARTSSSASRPERVDPGNPKWHTKNTPKVLGGVTAKCSELGRARLRAVHRPGGRGEQSRRRRSSRSCSRTPSA